jgi:hypothetical protein
MAEFVCKELDCYCDLDLAAYLVPSDSELSRLADQQTTRYIFDGKRPSSELERRRA